MNRATSFKTWLLIAGDCTTLLVVTLVGFATHGELPNAGLRVFTTFLPLLAAWMLVAPFTGVFSLSDALNPRRLWRPPWAMVLAAAAAALLRGWWLNRPVLPLFALVLAGSCALGILIWRVLFLVVARLRSS